MHSVRRSYWLIALLAVLSSRSAVAAVIEIGPADDLRAAVNALVPGDELVLRGGTYLITWRFSIGVSGTPATPIVIRAKVGEIPHLTRDPNQNTINVEGASHLILRELEVSGGSHGIRLTNASFITIEDCHVHDTGDVAISANVTGSSYQGLRLLRNHLHDTGGTGEGYYLGCNNAGCTMFDSLIEGNYIHDTVSGTSQGDGIEIKLGSYNNIVRGNVIHDTRYPCILVYGTGGNPVNIIERNLMWGCGDHGIQAAADAIIRNNIILGAAADGIHSQIHQGATPGNLVLLHNTVVVAGNAVRMDDIAQPVLIANNALYSQTASALRLAGNTGMVTSTGNLGRGSTVGVSGGFDGSGDPATDFVDVGNRDAHLVAGSKLIASGDPGQVATDDFNGAARGGVADIGAYLYTGSCAAANLAAVADLLAAKLGMGVTLQWTSGAGATEHHVNAVTTKEELAGDGPHRMDHPGGLATGECRASMPSSSCEDADALQSAGNLFYRVLAACGPDGLDEGAP